MAAPSSYTEEALETYMDAVLGPVADALGWTVIDGDYDESVNSALLAYGTDDISTISGLDNIAKLRALARVEVWRAVAAATAGHYDFSDGGVSLKRSQMHAQAMQAMRMAESDAMQYGAYGNEVEITAIQFVNDPYAYVDDDDRVANP